MLLWRLAVDNFFNISIFKERLPNFTTFVLNLSENDLVRRLNLLGISSFHDNHILAWDTCYSNICKFLAHFFLNRRCVFLAQFNLSNIFAPVQLV